ncbi:MAG: NAD(P)-dependent alcohol dehydrogenase [Thermodesulfovibrionia bacterium]|nr:NAD(P)-dependent alcohol dehydrogenase [Thermodesulfovibrionia bacterium]
MKAVVINRYGAADVLEYREVEKPAINDDEILVEVYASSVNPVDWKVRQGHLKVITGRKFPRILGCDFAGRIADVGGDIKNYKTGDEVFGMVSALQGGAYAEYVRVRPKNISAKPKNLNFEQAAAVPLAGLTALQSLRRLGKIKQGNRVLINGCSGGVGSCAVQIAKSFGAQVTGICSAKNIEFSKNLGADNIIDYTRENILERNETYDIFFDAVANQSFPQIKKLLTKHGIYITTLPSSIEFIMSMLTSLSRGKKLKAIFVKPDAGDLDYLKNLIENNKLHPAIDKSFVLSDVRQAHLYSETGRVRGKITLRIK